MSPCDALFGFCINIEVGYFQIFPSNVSFGFLSVQGAYILVSKLSSCTRLSHFASYFTSEDGGSAGLIIVTYIVGTLATHSGLSLLSTK